MPEYTHDTKWFHPRMLSTTSRLAPFIAVALGVAATGCSRDVIPNTDVADTAPNREVIDFVERYRKAVERQDTSKLLELASQSYLDDNGTPVGKDDVDYETLQKQLDEWNEQLLDVRYEIRYRRVTHRPPRVLVDYTYTASFQVKTPDGKRWARRLADNRLVLMRGGEGKFQILSGM